MPKNLNILFIIFAISFLLFSCSKDDENGSDEPDRYTRFDLSGGGIEQGTYNSENAGFRVLFEPGQEDETTVGFMTHRPDEHEYPFWKLDIGSIEGENFPLETGTYVLGNTSDFFAGVADFIVTFQSHTPSEGFPYVWGGTGNVDGILTITEIQTGVLNEGMNDLIIGTFEFTASDINDGSQSQPPLEDIVVTNGEFQAILTITDGDFGF